MNVVEADKDAIGMSMQIDPEITYRLDKRGRRLTSESGEVMPPLWHPRDLAGIDVVGDGDATRSMLSVSSAPMCVIKEYLSRMYGPEDCSAGRDAAKEWLDGVMDELWPIDDEPEAESISAETLQRRMELRRRMVG